MLTYNRILIFISVDCYYHTDNGTSHSLSCCLAQQRTAPFSLSRCRDVLQPLRGLSEQKAPELLMCFFMHILTTEIL